tara:strand:- start:384 stop:704 length:321 start_codon:yes stop_codon:yes gene_type:complete
MTKEDIIKLALEAGFELPWSIKDQEKLERFANLVAAAEPTCPECKAALLYECVACSSNNYPPQQQAEPVAQRPWVGLTEDEAFDCKGRDYFETYKAIEAKLKEKNT